MRARDPHYREPTPLEWLLIAVLFVVVVGLPLVTLGLHQ